MLDINEILELMEDIYLYRTKALEKGLEAARFMKSFSWSMQVDHLISEIDALYEA